VEVGVGVEVLVEVAVMVGVLLGVGVSVGMPGGAMVYEDVIEPSTISTYSTVTPVVDETVTRKWPAS
jgi:hypothetical protein